MTIRLDSNSSKSAAIAADLNGHPNPAAEAKRRIRTFEAASKPIPEKHDRDELRRRMGLPDDKAPTKPFWDPNMKTTRVFPVRPMRPEPNRRSNMSALIAYVAGDP